MKMMTMNYLVHLSNQAVMDKSGFCGEKFILELFSQGLVTWEKSREFLTDSDVPLQWKVRHGSDILMSEMSGRSHEALEQDFKVMLQDIKLVAGV